jgi:hypothetical protein
MRIVCIEGEEMKKVCRFITFPDIIIMSLILALAAVLFVFSTGGEAGSSLKITTPDGVVYLTRSCEYKIESNGYELTVIFAGGEAYIENSTCPGHDCVRSGRISKLGQSIICLPSRVSLELVGDGREVVDAEIG